MTISQVPLGEVPMKSTNENTRIIGRKNLYSDGNGQSSTNNVAFATNVKGQVRFAEVERFGGRRQPFKFQFQMPSTWARVMYGGEQLLQDWQFHL